MNTSAWIEALGWTLIHSVWQAALVAAGLWITCQLARRANPQLRYLAACLALVAVTAVAATTFARELRMPRAVAEPAANTVHIGPEPEPVLPSRQTEFPPGDIVVENTEVSSIAAAIPSARSKSETVAARFAWATSTLQRYTPAIVLLWLSGVGLFSIRLCRGWRVVQRLRLSGHAAGAAPLQARFAALCQSLQVPRATELLASAAVRVPMVIGWFKPVVLIPAGILSGMSPAQVEAILAHELAHIRRHDYLVNLLQNAIETVFFYHPAVWWISGVIRKEREHCCDDLASAATGGALHYVSALAALEECRANESNLALAANGGALLARARRLLLVKPSEGPSPGLLAGGLALVLMAAVLLIPLGLSRAADDPAPEGKIPPAPTERLSAGAAEPPHAFDAVKRGALWTADQLERLPFGAQNRHGLRAAWIFRPMQNAYVIGDSLVCRIIVHNAGSDPVEFLADSWITDAQWSVLDSAGTSITPKKTKFARVNQTEQRHRLAPGDAVELATPGLGIGPGEFDEVVGEERIGVYLPARAGDEFRCKWELTFRGAWAQSDDASAAVPVPVKLETGEVKFRVVDRDPAGPKPVSIAIAPGRYTLEPGLHLRILRMNWQPIVIVNGVAREPLPVRESNSATISAEPADIPPGGRITRSGSGVRLPDGDGTYVIAWQRGERTLWIGETYRVRKVDLTVAGRFPLMEVLDTVDPLEREKLRELANKHGTGSSFPEREWRWDDTRGFEGTPAEIKEALEKHRPQPVKADPRDGVFEPPLDAAKIYADAERLASSYRPPGKDETESAKDERESLSLLLPSATPARVGGGELRVTENEKPALPSAEPPGEHAREVLKHARGENKVAEPVPAAAEGGKPAAAAERATEIRPNAPNAETPAHAPAPAEKLTRSREALDQQRAVVERTRSEVAALNQFKPEDAVEAFRSSKTEDETTRKTISPLQDALAEEAKLLAAGAGDDHVRLKSLRAEIAHFRKLLADQLESIKRAYRTKLQIEETQLKTMEAHFNRSATQPEARHEQTRDLLKLWQAEFVPKPLFPIAINEKVQRKENPPAVPRGSDDPAGRDVTFLDQKLAAEAERSKPLPATVPAEAMRRVAKQVRKYIESSPGPAAEKFQQLLSRLEAERVWPWAEVVAMLDELCDIATGPVGWLELEEQFRAFNRAKRGQAWDADALKALPFGPANEQGLRAAWIFEPMRPSYAVGDVLKSRVLFHNSGKEPIEFRTDAWHQEDRWHVVDAAGNPVKVKTTWYTGLTPLQRFRLEPGQVVEVPGHGVGIGGGDYAEKYSVGAIGAEIPAKPGDELRCAWDVKLDASDRSDPNAAATKPLRTGEVKFRVVAADPNAPKPPGAATAPGRYDLAPGIKLQITQVTSGKDGEPTKRENSATILWFDAKNAQTHSWRTELPPGLGSYVITWTRGSTTMWIGKHDAVQKINFSNATYVRAQDWPWEDSGDFGGIPADTRALLEKHRPKATAQAAPIPAPANPAEAPKQKWKAAGRVTDPNGNAMADVEIWVHTGMGSLLRTGVAKTDADGRYEVEFGLAVMTEKESAQLQVANITAHKDGFFEKNLNRQGAGAAALREVSADDLKGYGVTVHELVLPGKPREVNFVMAPARKIKGRLVGTGSFPRLPPQDYRGAGEQPIAGHTVLGGSPLRRWKVWLTGPELPPATSVLASAETDEDGRFEFANVPAGFKWQIQADTHVRGSDPRSPLFSGPWEANLILEVELDEKQTALKFVPATAKSDAPGAAETNNRFREVTRPSIFTSTAKRPSEAGQQAPVPASPESASVTGAPENRLFAEGTGPVTPLIAAAEAGNLQEVRRHLAAGEDPNARTGEKAANGALIGGITPLFAAAVRGHVEVTKALLDAGAEPQRATAANGRFPLMEIIHAIKDDATLEAMVKLLLERGADPNQRSAKIGSALHFAVVQNKPAVARQLVAAGAKLDAKSRDGKTPLDLAREHNRDEIINVLTEAEAPFPNE